MQTVKARYAFGKIGCALTALFSAFVCSIDASKARCFELGGCTSTQYYDTKDVEAMSF